jgi:hypothetical protein
MSYPVAPVASVGRELVGDERAPAALGCVGDWSYPRDGASVYSGSNLRDPLAFDPPDSTEEDGRFLTIRKIWTENRGAVSNNLETAPL